MSSDRRLRRTLDAQAQMSLPPFNAPCMLAPTTAANHKRGHAAPLGDRQKLHTESLLALPSAAPPLDDSVCTLSLG